MWRRVTHVRTNDSEQRIFPIIKVKKLVTPNIPNSLILLTLLIQAMRSWKRLFLQEPHDVTSQNSEFFIVTAVKTSYLA
jgi:hypothetical protein